MELLNKMSKISVSSSSVKEQTAREMFDCREMLQMNLHNIYKNLMLVLHSYITTRSQFEEYIRGPHK